MSRYTEIETAAHNAYEDYLYENSQDFANGIGIGFRRGAEWADEHPNLYNDEKYHTVKVSCLDELNRKAKLYDEFLEKTCEWMRNQKCQEYPGGSLERIIPDFIIEQYKQVMEELGGISQIENHV